MGDKTAINQMRFIASLGLAPRDAIPAAVAVVERAITCVFAVLFLVDPAGRPLDAYLANPVPEAMEGFLSAQANLRQFPEEPTLDKMINAGLVVDALGPFRGAKLVETRTYRDVLAHFGIGMGLDITVRDKAGGAVAVIILNRPFLQDIWSDAEKVLLASLHDSLSAIFTSAAEPSSDAWSEPPDRAGYLVADEAGAVHFAAGEANLLVAQYCQLRFTEGLAYRDLLVRLPGQLRDLVQLAKRDGMTLASATSPWGQVSVRVLRELRDTRHDGAERYQIILERRLSRPAVVAQNVSLAPLSPRERELAYLFGLGLPSDQIAARMQITPATLKTYAKSVYGKMEVENRAMLEARLRQVG